MTSPDAGVLGMQRLDHDECLRLLAIEDVGRVAVIHGRAPSIFPVNYALDGTTVVGTVQVDATLGQGAEAVFVATPTSGAMQTVQVTGGVRGRSRSAPP